MQKARLALVAISIFAVAGGVYSAKVNCPRPIYFRTAGTTQCTFEVLGFSTTTVIPNQLPVTTIAVPLATVRGICTTTTIYYTC